MSMLSTTANWHWKNKNVTSWAKSWFQEELTKISIQGEGQESVNVTSTSFLDGDVELGQRKSKLITIYDCKISVEWTGTASDGTEVSGKVTIPEVSHEITLDGLSDYAYQWSDSASSNPAVSALYTFAKARLPTALEAKFAEFPVAIIEKHGKDLTISAEPSRTGTPAPASGSSTPGAPLVAKTVAAAKTALNTVKVVKEATFMAAADDLFGLLTDPRRNPKLMDASTEPVAKPDTAYSLLGGNVKGKYISLTPGKEIIQTWALQSPQWPTGHEAILTTTFDQSFDSTTVTFTLSGVPIGMENEIERNIEGYYVGTLNSNRYAQLIVSPTYSKRTRAPKASRTSVSPNSDDGTNHTAATAVAIAIVVLAAAFCLPYLSYPSLSLRSFAK